MNRRRDRPYTALMYSLDYPCTVGESTWRGTFPGWPHELTFFRPAFLVGVLVGVVGSLLGVLLPTEVAGEMLILMRIRQRKRTTDNNSCRGRIPHREVNT